MTIHTENNIIGQFTRPNPETLERESRQQADAVIALRRMLSQCPNKELRLSAVS